MACVMVSNRSLRPQEASNSDEDRAFTASVSYNFIVAICVVILVIGTLLPAMDRDNGFAGFMMLASIIGTPFLVISFARNLTLINKVTTSGRKAYAIIATLATGLACIGLLGLLVR